MSDGFREYGHTGSREDVAVERLPADLEAIYDRLARDGESWAWRLPEAAPLQDYLHALGAGEVTVDTATQPAEATTGWQGQVEFTDERTERPVPSGRLVSTPRAPSRRAVWGGALSAVAVVALLASTFILLPRTHGTAKRTATTATASPQATICPPDKITLRLPAHAELYQLEMTSPTDGWALGRTVSLADSGDQTTNPLLVRFSQCRWAPVPDPLPGANADLHNISMTSATDGWAAGSEASGASQRCVLLHYTGGQWQRAALPPQIPGSSGCNQIRMFSPNEGWLLAQWDVPGDDGLPPEHLLHYVNGVWTLVESPISEMFDVETVGPDDVWVGGLRPPAKDDPNRIETIDMAHYAHGQWTTFHLAVGGAGWIHMNSPSDGWLVSATTPTQVLHYDGSAWQQTPFSNLLSPNNGTIVFDANDVWTFTYGLTPSTALPINNMRHEVGGQWQTVPWPFPDDFVRPPFTRVAPGDYWAIGVHETGTDPIIKRWVLLHYAGGAWHEYSS